jgi:hypothetical protein
MLFEFVKVIIGVISATIAYVITKFILDNILQQRKIMVDIADSLIFYKNVYTNSISKEEDYKEASNKFRKFASALRANVKIIPFYAWLEKLKAVCGKSNIDNAAMNLIGLSNGCLGLIDQRNDDLMRIANNEKRVNEIKRLLDLPFVD